MLVDDHEIVRQGCRLLFEQAGYTVVGEVSSGEEAYEKHLKLRPQLIVMDLAMPGVGGIETIRRIHTHSPQARIVVFTMRDNPFIVTRVLRAGVLAYVTKTNSPQILLEAVKRALVGGLYLSQDIAQSIALSNMDIRNSPLVGLTRRELEIFRMLSEGRSSSEIADTLSLSQKSVANYSLRIKQKLGVRNIAELVRLAMSEGIIEREA
ncbi:MAG: response regulator [Gammaproteobacteria bacterium]